MKKYFRFQNLVITVLSAMVLGTVCNLGVFYSVLMGMIIFFFLPSFIKYREKEKESYEKYSQACVYMEQMESSFKKNKRIYQSLKETVNLFPEGEMKETLEAAIHEIEKEDAQADSSERALLLIEEKYGCEQMELMHNFFLKSQAQGGEVSQAVDMLEKRRNTWMYAVEKCRAEKKNMLFSVLGSLVLFFAVTEVLVLFLPESMDITENIFERTAVVIEFTILMFMGRCVLKKNAADWLERVREREEEKIRKDYRYVENYNLAKEMVTSIKWAAIPFVITVLSYFMTKSLIALSVGTAITVLLLNQHKMNYSLTKKRIKKETERDFPKWMLHVILLLETESVQGAIRKSAAQAPASLQYPLEKMQEGFEEDATGPSPYFAFLEEYEVPKIQESMKLLYSISSGTGGDGNEQMLAVIEKNNDMTLRSEKIKNDNKVAGMMTYLFLPVLPSGIKIMTDLILIMMVMYGSMNTLF